MSQIIKAGEQAVAPRERSILDVIADAVRDPSVDVDKMTKLFDLQERVIQDQRKVAFAAAMGRLAAKMPEIGKHGESHHGTYARLEDIDRAIRPLLSAEGFSMSFDSEAVGKDVKVSCKLTHEAGHSETKAITLQIDNSGSKNPAQAVISTVSYGRRALTKMFFNLMESGEDTDGNDPSVITEEQARDLQAAVEGVGMNLSRFCVYMGVGKLADILARDYQKALTAVDAKRAGK